MIHSLTSLRFFCALYVFLFDVRFVQELALSPVGAIAEDQAHTFVLPDDRRPVAVVLHLVDPFRPMGLAYPASPGIARNAIRMGQVTRRQEANPWVAIGLGGLHLQCRRLNIKHKIK
ncbi:hypothetical protein IVB12_06325 [Bradyrhizobium sp. 179]|uniref:hypothetical protein n=1 Tax=Bradyrhizobium sp. 179 TaxID=2782648 RepID=UPI001FFBF5A2|nr:hypothetical protein [Bradyrhizobium sp. 179]MCK1541605.1 hypothetical protein [Bradyrhizobium sp. 179]